MRVSVLASFGRWIYHYTSHLSVVPDAVGRMMSVIRGLSNASVLLNLRFGRLAKGVVWWEIVKRISEIVIRLMERYREDG
jgi:hypothetical protein